MYEVIFKRMPQNRSQLCIYSFYCSVGFSLVGEVSWHDENRD